MTRISRRSALGGLAVLGLTGCMPQNRNPGAALSSGGVLVAQLADFPSVGSYKQLEIAKTPAVIIRVTQAQPQGVSAGELHLIALSRVCTHLGCTVNSPKDNLISCPCHGSQYDANTGAVTRGPAPDSLASFKLELRGTDVYAVS